MSSTSQPSVVSVSSARNSGVKISRASRSWPPCLAALQRDARGTQNVDSLAEQYRVGHLAGEGDRDERRRHAARVLFVDLVSSVDTAGEEGAGCLQRAHEGGGDNTVAGAEEQAAQEGAADVRLVRVALGYGGGLPGCQFISRANGHYSPAQLGDVWNRAQGNFSQFFDSFLRYRGTASQNWPTNSRICTTPRREELFCAQY
jgi:hypothetical protein